MNTKETFLQDCTLEHGIARWKSNHRVPPLDVLQQFIKAGVEHIDIAACEAVSNAEISALLKSYREQKHLPPSPNEGQEAAGFSRVELSTEHLAELRANFEPGTTIINILSGHRISL